MPTVMSSMSTNQEEKVFEYYPSVPPEIKMMIVDEMETADRVRFTRCSKKSRKEARASKNFMYGLKISEHPLLQISLIYSNIGVYRPGYYLNFEQYGTTKYIVCRSQYEMELWRDVLPGSINMAKMASYYIENWIAMYQFPMKMLSITGCNFDMDIDLGIESLPNLKSLIIKDKSDIRHFLPKLRGPLEELIIYRRENCRYLETREEIYQVSKSLTLSRIQLNDEQLQRLIAPNVTINNDYLIWRDSSRFPSFVRNML